MYVVVHHAIKDSSIAFDRGRKLMVGEGAPPSTRVLQFLPSLDGSAVTCLWESASVGSRPGLRRCRARRLERQRLLPGRC